MGPDISKRSKTIAKSIESVQSTGKVNIPSPSLSNIPIAIPKRKRRLYDMHDNTIMRQNQSKEKSPVTILSRKNIIRTHHSPNISLTNSLRPDQYPAIKSTTSSLRPDQYPTINVEQFWRSHRSWNFVNDLNDHMNKHPKNNSSNITQLESSNGSEDDDLYNGNVNDDDAAKGSSSSNYKLSNSSTILPLPDRFDSYQQYAALWAPLQLQEAKAQLLSDVYSSNTPLLRMLIPVKVTPNMKSKKDSMQNALLCIFHLHLMISR